MIGLMTRFVRRTIITVILSVFVAMIGHSLQRSGPRREAAIAAWDTLWDFPWLTDSYRFERAILEADGRDTSKIAALSDHLARLGTKAFLILRHGKIVHEWYAPYHGAGAKYQTASLAKALVGSMALLIAIDDGSIKLDDRASEYIPTWRADPWRSAIKIQDLADHTSGIEHADVNGEVSHETIGWKGEYWRHPERRFEIALHVAPIKFPPGSNMVYSGPGYTALSYALAASLRNAPVSDLKELLRTRIMGPLGIPDNHWRIGYGRRFNRDGLTLYLFEGGGRYTARAVARVGQLIVARGIWEGKKILSTQLIDSLIRGGLASPVPRTEQGPISVLGWWSNTERGWPHLPEDTLIGAGSGHQVLVVIPSHGLVIVRQGGSLGGPQWGEEYWRVLDHHLLRPVAELFVDGPSANRHRSRA